MKPALEKFLLIAATLAAIGLFVFVAMWSSIKDKKTQMDDLFNNTNVPSSFMDVTELKVAGNVGSIANANFYQPSSTVLFAQPDSLPS
jgi:flagellar biosynthesis/type III secretory pathway M-ring protein FliF/YscJ